MVRSITLLALLALFTPAIALADDLTLTFEDTATGDKIRWTHNDVDQVGLPESTMITSANGKTYRFVVAVAEKEDTVHVVAMIYDVEVRGIPRRLPRRQVLREDLVMNAGVEVMKGSEASFREGRLIPLKPNQQPEEGDVEYREQFKVFKARYILSADPGSGGEVIVI